MSTPPPPFFPWKDDYFLQIEVIDNQHQHLVKLVGDLHESVVANESKAARLQHLTRLYNFAKAHYAAEELLLRLRRYPGYLTHKAAHEGLAKALNSLREEVASGVRELTVEYVELIKLWLIDHFGEFDRPCASFLCQENGQAEQDSMRLGT